MKFFEYKECEYFPCHNNYFKNTFNCLFCFCPLYHLDCPGNPTFINGIKECTYCTFPHDPENYKKIINILKQ